MVTTTARLLTSPASLSATRTIIAIEMTAASPIALLTQQAWEHSLSASQVSPSVLHLSLALLLTTTSALAVGDARPLARRSARHRDGLSPPGRDHWSVIRPFLSPNDRTEIWRLTSPLIQRPSSRISTFRDSNSNNSPLPLFTLPTSHTPLPLLFHAVHLSPRRSHSSRLFSLDDPSIQDSQTRMAMTLPSHSPLLQSSRRSSPSSSVHCPSHSHTSTIMTTSSSNSNSTSLLLSFLVCSPCSFPTLPRST